ncbi:MAG: hypothetical protein JWL75_385 [Parcubacteria group bacterium]|nr:hypothetical protein [Parcubacteria group bacterium]
MGRASTTLNELTNARYTFGMNKTSYIVAGIIVVLVGIGLFFGMKHSNTTPTPDPMASSTTVLLPPAPGVKVPVTADGAVSTSSAPHVTITPVASGRTFSDKNWSISFMLLPEWNITPINGSKNTLHQLQLASSKNVVFVSKDENIAVSGSLTYTTATRTIAGQSVQVRTYSNVESPFKYYQMFSLKESDGTYSFLLKSATSNTNVLDAFIASIAKK